jgi:hypothetical protein
MYILWHYPQHFPGGDQERHVSESQRCAMLAKASHIWSANYYYTTFSTKGCWSAQTYKGKKKGKRRREIKKERKREKIQFHNSEHEHIQYLWFTSVLPPLQINHGWNPTSASNDFWSTHFWSWSFNDAVSIATIQCLGILFCSLEMEHFCSNTHFFMTLHCRSDQFSLVPVHSYARNLTVNFSRLFFLKLSFLT